MLGDATDVGLDELGVFAQFSELMPVVPQIDAIEILDVDAGDIVGFFLHDVTDVTVLELVLILNTDFFIGASTGTGIEHAVDVDVGGMRGGGFGWRLGGRFGVVGVLTGSRRPWDAN